MRLWLCAAALNGFLAVAFGAHAAHSLRGRVEPEIVAWVEVGSDYGMAHALALIGVALLAGRAPGSSWTLRCAGWAFLAGTVLFSGVLYVMGLTGWRTLGAIVPVGGVLLLGGWAALFGYGLGLVGAGWGGAGPGSAGSGSAGPGGAGSGGGSN